jgi:ATP-dependent RNA helicase DOB1
MTDVMEGDLGSAGGAAAAAAAATGPPAGALAPPVKRQKVEPRARLGDDRVAAMPVGQNLIEVDGKSCTHEVCWPPGMAGSSEPPPRRAGPPAREFPFALDPFQQTAVNALEAGARGGARAGGGGGGAPPW